MSEQLIRGLFAVIDAREWSKLGTFFDSEVRYERPGYEPIHGLEALVNFYAHVRIVARGEHHLFGIADQADLAACWGIFRGVSVDGDLLEERFADTYSIRAGRVLTRTIYFYRPAI